MTEARPAFAALDDILSQTRHLLIAFDGPIRPGTSAEPTAYLQDVISSCRETGRSTIVITSTPVHVVTAYLAEHGLDKEFAAVVAEALEAKLIEQAARELDTDPAACALVTSTPAHVEAARTTRTHTIGYAKTPEERARLAAAGAEAVIPTMASLALRLRARWFAGPGL